MKVDGNIHWGLDGGQPGWCVILCVFLVFHPPIPSCTPEANLGVGARIVLTPNAPTQRGEQGSLAIRVHYPTTRNVQLLVTPKRWCSSHLHESKCHAIQGAVSACAPHGELPFSVPGSVAPTTAERNWSACGTVNRSTELHSSRQR